MRILLFLLSVLSLVFTVNSQDYLLVFDQYNAGYNYNWRGLDERWEGITDDWIDERAEFVEYAKENGLLKNQIEAEKHWESFSVKNHLHILDINNDGQDDVIFAGPSGGEADIVIFYLNKNGTYQKIFEVYQGIVKVEWEQGKISRLYTHDWGCCGAPDLNNVVYSVSYDKGLPVFEKEYESIELGSMRKPLMYFEEPIEFVVKNEVYKLRSSPEINDKDYFLPENIPGNTMAVYSNGAIGKAYASYTDDTGRIWWYVEMDPSSTISDNNLYWDEPDFPVHIVGWMSSRYLEIFEKD